MALKKPRSVENLMQLNSAGNLEFDLEETLKRKVSRDLFYRKDYEDIRLADLATIKTLGKGMFGRVELVSAKNKTFALKILDKFQIIETGQQQHVENERRLLLACNSAFILKLYRSFKASRTLYMLLEPCMGGDLWSVLHHKIQFDEKSTRFYVACVLEALDYLHRRGMAHRDLKTENMLLDTQGYVKLGDLGFAKKLTFGSKTYTFCGTPEYMAPEVILKKGHDMGVDLWALGILIYEMLCGVPPFTGSDPIKVFNKILVGFENWKISASLGKNSINLVKKLCADKVEDRLGYGKSAIKFVRKEKWFKGFDFDALKNRQMTAPFVPKAENFDENSGKALEDLTENENGGDFSDWDVHFF